MYSVKIDSIIFAPQDLAESVEFQDAFAEATKEFNKVLKAANLGIQCIFGKVECYIAEQNHLDMLQESQSMFMASEESTHAQKH